jgi:serine/threonine protein kinase
MSEGRESGRSAKPEKLLGEYSILAELARGGMGKVYVARRSGQAGFERYFAIKVMHQQLNEDQNAVMMLLDEAHIASRLHHPNVVPVLDIGTFGDGYYLVMDYVEGCSLQQLLKLSPEHRPIKALVSVMLDSLRGLHAVHTLRGINDEELHVVHRDVSPHNLLLGLDGGCRVTDFGIAKAKQRFTDTGMGGHKGKLAFMAPEQMRGAQNLDARVDVWAAGVTLYSALTGVHPFREENDAATIHAVLGAVIPPPSEVGLKPLAAFDDVVMRALQRDPDARYATAEEFAEALRSVALREGVLGSSSDVAHWVKATCGARLADRRRKLAGIPKSSDATITSGTSTVPKLWFNQDSGGNTSASGSSPDLTIQADFRPASSSFAGRTLHARRGLAIGAIVAVVLAMTVVLILNKTAQTERADTLSAPPSAALPAAIVAPAEPAKPRADEPVATSSESPAAMAPSAQTPAPASTKPAAPTTPARPTAVDADAHKGRPRVAAPVVKTHKPSSASAAIVSSAVQSLSELRKDAAAASAAEVRPAAAAPATPAPPAPARSPARLGANPYLLGE